MEGLTERRFLILDKFSLTKRRQRRCEAMDGNTQLFGAGYVINVSETNCVF